MRTAVVLSFVLVVAAVASSGWAKDNHEELVDKAMEIARKEWEERQMALMVNGSQVRARRHPKYPVEAEEQDRSFAIYSRASDLLKSWNVTHHNAHRTLRQATGGSCPQRPASCSRTAPYRSFDGSCNNVDVPWWGQAGTMQTRLISPVYEDRRNTPRGGFQSYLPNPRIVSTKCHPDFQAEFPGITNMVPQFGQFLDHDMSITPEADSQCCSGSSDPNCWSIPIPSDDPFYSRLSPRQTCMSFTRSTPCSNPQTGAREQMNMNTIFIDGSQIYGSSAARADRLRSKVGGRMVTNDQGWNGFLPFSTNSRFSGEGVKGAFIAGDDRVNEMPGLAVMHNLFLMEHNRIADQFRSRGFTNDEQIYQETRRIVGALMQQVTYNEYLPVVLGPDMMKNTALGLQLPPPGEYSQNGPYGPYDPSVDPSCSNEFSTAAYRFAHTLVPGLVKLFSTSGSQIGSYNIKDQYFQANQITQSNGQGYDWILKGLMSSNSQNFDPYGTTGLTNFLFAPSAPNNANNFGSDLFARNIHRGRDHGIPGFNAYRQACGRAPVNFNSQPADMGSRQWNDLRSCYRNPDDIDLFTGGLHELPHGGGVSGYTFQCIKGDQFSRVKKGDRFFFTHSSNPRLFTQDQLRELRRQTLGDIICRNSQQQATQRNVFLVASSSTNPLAACRDQNGVVLANRLLNMNYFF